VLRIAVSAGRHGSVGEAVDTVVVDVTASNALAAGIVRVVEAGEGN
jgi:hypothetical protein